MSISSLKTNTNIVKDFEVRNISRIFRISKNCEK